MRSVDPVKPVVLAEKSSIYQIPQNIAKRFLSAESAM